MVPGGYRSQLPVRLPPQGASPTEVVAYLGGVVVLAFFLAVAARVLLAQRRRIAVTRESWPPALALGLITGAVGLPWAALPVVQVKDKDVKSKEG